MLYSVDDFGNPAGLDWDTDQLATGMVWRTARHPHWYGLGVRRRLATGEPGRTIAERPRISGSRFRCKRRRQHLHHYGPGGWRRWRRRAALRAESLPRCAIRHTGGRRSCWHGMTAAAQLSTMRNRGDVVLTFAAEPIRLPTEPAYDDGIGAGLGSDGLFCLERDGLARGPGLTEAPAEPDGEPDVIGFFTVVVEEPTPADAPPVGWGAPRQVLPNVEVPPAPRLIPDAAPLLSHGPMTSGPAARAPARATEPVDEAERDAPNSTDATPATTTTRPLRVPPAQRRPARRHHHREHPAHRPRYQRRRPHTPPRLQGLTHRPPRHPQVETLSGRPTHLACAGRRQRCHPGRYGSACGQCRR